MAQTELHTKRLLVSASEANPEEAQKLFGVWHEKQIA